MPLSSIPAQQAFANLRGRRASLWPDGRRDLVRLNSIAQVEFEPRAQFQPDDAIFTVGSCFARNIESRLATLGFALPTRAFILPAEERASDTENDFLNKYPPHAILNEFRWALDPSQAFPEEALLQLGPELWHDPHAAPNVAPATLARVRERRAMIAKLYSQLPQCRVIIMTLGLVEAWFDSKIGVYLNGAPPAAAFQAEPDRFRLDVLTPMEIHDVLAEIYSLLERFGHPDFRLLVTVSPVPFRNTFTGRDSITANTYSKSALRVAAEMFGHGRERVEYIPSYEIVTHTNRAAAYIQDNRHVTPQVVNEIVERVVRAYCPDLSPTEAFPTYGARRTGREIVRAQKGGNFALAAHHFESLQPKGRYLRAGYTEFTYRFEYGRLLMRIGHMAEAQVQLARAVALEPDQAEATHQLGRALARLQRPMDAEEWFRRAVALDPASPVYRMSLVNGLVENGDLEGAEAQLSEILAADPQHEGARTALDLLRSKTGRRTPAEVAPAASPAPLAS